MTVLHVTPYFAPAWAFGGVCRAVTGLARAQASAGHSVVVLTTDALSRSSRITCAEEVLDGVRVVRVRNALAALRARVNLSTPPGFRSAARRLIDAHRIDVVHCHELRTLENVMVTRLAHPAMPPIVVSPHGTVPYGTGRSRAKLIWDRLLAARMLPSFAQVVALSPAEAADVRDLWERYRVPLRGDQIAVVPNGVDAGALAGPPARAQARARWKVGSDPVVLFLGRLIERKGLALLLSAFAEVLRAVPSARLVVAGPDEGAGADVIARADALGIRNRVVLTGYVTGEDRLAAFAAADLFALPAVGEGLPIAVLEAMACGLPVAISPECQLADVGATGGGLVVPRTVEAWVAALIALLASAERRAVMGRLARAHAVEKYSWAQISSRVCSVYEIVLQRTRVAG
jgi:glycosyltransferase involved in cell wall biosynthesis